jgi:hypothetical protein
MWKMWTRLNSFRRVKWQTFENMGQKRLKVWALKDTHITAIFELQHITSLIFSSQADPLCEHDKKKTLNSITSKKFLDKMIYYRFSRRTLYQRGSKYVRVTDIAKNLSCSVQCIATVISEPLAHTDYKTGLIK